MRQIVSDDIASLMAVKNDNTLWIGGVAPGANDTAVFLDAKTERQNVIGGICLYLPKYTQIMAGVASVERFGSYALAHKTDNGLYLWGEQHGGYTVTLTKPTKITESPSQFIVYQNSLAVLSNAGVLKHWNLHQNYGNNPQYKDSPINVAQNVAQIVKYNYTSHYGLYVKTNGELTLLNGELGFYKNSNLPEIRYKADGGETCVMSGVKKATLSHGYTKIAVITSKDDLVMLGTDSGALLGDGREVKDAANAWNLPVKECFIREHILNWKHGSAFDAWVEMGARILDEGDVEYLKRVSVPKVQIRKAQTLDGELEISAELEPLEVRLIEVAMKA